ncbi:MAG: hypothetical protein M3Q95_02655 [Bacteroidota bacterium]|nr:hypothetical protein [Bacteroidota bacterium]
MKNILTYIALILVFTSCEKEEVPIKLPPPGTLQTMTANMGSYYDDQVYVDFETGVQKVVPYRSYDLAFEASATGFRVYLNTGKYMFVANTGSTDLTIADSTGKEWKTEPDNLYDDSTAFGNWADATLQSNNEVFVIDRGRTEHFGSSRWRKIQLVWVNANEYRIRFSMYNNTQVTEFTVPKNSDYSLMYFSFENGGQMVDVAPRKNNWDVVFTKYTHIYLSEPVTSPYRYYIVSGVLLNRWSDNESAIAKKDSTPSYKPFNEVTVADIGAFNFNNNAAQIGFEWKIYDFNLGYTIIPDQYYMLRDPSGYYYKIRFIDFYDDQGNKGAASLEYQRL